MNYVSPNIENPYAGMARTVKCSAWNPFIVIYSTFGKVNTMMKDASHQE